MLKIVFLLLTSFSNGWANPSILGSYGLKDVSSEKKKAILNNDWYLMYGGEFQKVELELSEVKKGEELNPRLKYSIEVKGRDRSGSMLICGSKVKSGKYKKLQFSSKCAGGAIQKFFQDKKNISKTLKCPVRGTNSPTEIEFSYISKNRFREYEIESSFSVIENGVETFSASGVSLGVDLFDLDGDGSVDVFHYFPEGKSEFLERVYLSSGGTGCVDYSDFTTP